MTRLTLRTGLVSLLLAALAAAATAQADDELEIVELMPSEPAGWRPSALFAPVVSLFRGGPSHYFNPREIVVRTVPPGAALDFSYVRRSFQKGFEQGDAPCKLVLPSPSSAGEFDTVKIRAFLDGYRQAEASIPVRSLEDELVLELEPVTNSLVAATHLYFADRVWLGFVTEEALVARTQEARDGFSLVLLETAAQQTALESLSRVRNPLVASIAPQQLGEDLVLRLTLSDAADRDAVRQLQSYDAVRRLHVYTLVIEPAGGAGRAVRRVLDALARIRREDVSGCALAFEDVLRERIEPAALARALEPTARHISRELRAAMRRLGELSPGGTVLLADGSEYRTAASLELTAAMSQAAEVHGYLALLRAFVAQLEPEASRLETLRGVVAPELAPGAFADVVAAAEAAEVACRAR